MEKTFFDSLPEFDLETILASAKEFSNSTEDYDEPQEIWLVHHHHREGMLNWTCAFDSEAAAEDFMTERVDMYSMQDACITEDEYGNVYIAKDEDATVVVRMYMEPVYLNCPEQQSFKQEKREGFASLSFYMFATALKTVWSSNLA